jgi:tetratricopeptide (TPR) repeat protein
MKNQEVNIAKIAKYDKIIKKNPSKHQAYDLKGRALMEINRLEESLECYNKAIKLESNNKIYLAQRAKLYGLTDQADKAFEDLKLISQLQQHSNEDAFNNLILFNTLQEVQKLDSDKIQENKALKQSTPQYKLEVKDTNELLEKFLLGGKALELNNKSLDDMTNILLPVKIEDKKKGCCESIRNKCVIFSVKDMIYDNELLNHPEILRSSVKEFGISRVLDMSSNLSSELISEAIEQNDVELLLAGCISLNHSDVI